MLQLYMPNEFANRSQSKLELGIDHLACARKPFFDSILNPQEDPKTKESGRNVNTKYVYEDESLWAFILKKNNAVIGVLKVTEQ